MEVLAPKLIEHLEPRTLLSATVAAPLTNLSVNPGAAPSTIDLSGDFTDPQVTGTPVLLKTTNGNIPLEMLDTVAPNTVANFLRYVNGRVYNGTVFHRTVTSFIDQSGGYYADGTAVPSFGTIANEFHTSNTRGTLAMAKSPGDPNSATSQWFVNDANNSGVLDTQNGGFTVFAQVLYNGMRVVDAINSLPTIDGSLLSPSLPGKPDDPLPVRNASAGVTPSNLVVVNSAAVVAPLSYSVTSDEPKVATAAIGSDGHSLLLSYSSTHKGVAHITVTATDLGGTSVSEMFRVNVGTTGDLLNVIVGKGAAKSATLTQADGTPLTVSFKGPGKVTLEVLGDSIKQSTAKSGSMNISGTAVSLFGLVASGTTRASVLSIMAKSGHVGTIGNITTDSALGRIIGKGVALTGDLTAAGPIDNLTLAGVTNADLVGAPSTISAPSMGTITVSGDLSDADIELTAPGIDVRSLQVKGTMTAAVLDAAGAVGSVTATNLDSATVFVGVAADVSRATLPTSASQFTSTASIKSVQVRGTFSDTLIAASSVLHAQLGRVTSVSGKPFGFAARQVNLLNVRNSTGKVLAFHHLATAAAGASAQSQIGVSDFNLNLL